MSFAFARALALGVFCTVTAACESGRSPGAGGSTRKAAENAQGLPRPAFVRGPSAGAAVEPFIAEEVRRGKDGKYGVLVYVGAAWCEPCQRFHQAVLAGQLDALLAGIRLVEFDLDADRAPLERAGYGSKLIPLFVVPRADGTASDVRMEGSIKGESAVSDNLAPRLRALLDRARSSP